MSINSTPQQDGELQNTSTNAVQSNGNNSTYSEEEIDNFLDQISPLNIVEVPEVGWITTLGKFKLTHPEKTIEDTINWLKTNQWELTLRLIACVAEDIFNRGEVNLLKKINGE